MGACIGSKSSKYPRRKPSQSDTTKPLQAKPPDDVVQKKLSPSSSERLPVTDDFLDINDDDYRLSRIDEYSISSQLQHILDEQNIIIQALSQPLASRIISITDAELELELGNLMFEQTHNDSGDKNLTTTNNDCKSA